MRFSRLILFILTALALHAQDMIVTNFQQLTANGGRVAWGQQNNLIAFDRPNTAGLYDVWTMNPDGSNQTCLTCNFEVGYHKGNPDWHPSGNFIVFEAQRTDVSYFSESTSTPGVGVDNVIWIMDAAGQRFWQILPNSAFSPHAGGVLHPHFSHDGNTLIWAQLTDAPQPGGPDGPDGNWEIQVASFAVDVNGNPVVTITNTLTPGAYHSFYETHGFSLDDKTIFFSGNPDGQPHFGTDIYSCDLQGNNFVNLTNTPNDWDEHSRPSPTQEKLMWVSSVGTTTTSQALLLLEYWTMNYDGSDKKKMTWFTDTRATVCAATATDCTNPAQLATPGTVGDNDWSPDGTQSVVYIVNLDSSGGSTLGANGSIWLMTLAPSSTTASSGSYLNYPQAPDSIATSFGADLANQTTAAPTIPLPTNLAGTQVAVTDVQGATRPAPLFFASANQVNWYVPTGTAPGPATVITTSGDGTTTKDIFDVEAAAPAIYSINGSGAGPAAGYVVTPTQPYVPVYACAAQCTTSPVDVSSGNAVLVLFGTGVRNSTPPVIAALGTQNVTATFAGPQGDFIGLDQINVPLPASLAGSGLVNVSLSVSSDFGPVASNVVQIDIQ